MNRKNYFFIGLPIFVVCLIFTNFYVFNPVTDTSTITSDIDLYYPQFDDSYLPTTKNLAKNQTTFATGNTFLDKTVTQWQNEDYASIMSYRKIHQGDFYQELGAFMLKNKMLNQLHHQNITLTDSDFKIYPGMTLTSDPPIIGFETYVNDTAGNTFRLTGSIQMADASNVNITKLEFFDTTKKLPLDYILSDNNTIVFQNQNQSSTQSYNLIISGNNDVTVNFKNELDVPIRIQSSEGHWQTPDWYGPTIIPHSSDSFNFDVGVYEWHARTLPTSEDIGSHYVQGGQINIIPDDTRLLSSHEKQLIGVAILSNSEIPWSGIGPRDDKEISLNFNTAIYYALPDVKKYYTQRAEQLIPFDIPIIVWEP